jgi:hypothetical protein
MMTTDRPAPVTIARVGGTEADLLVLGDSYIAYRSAGTTTVRNDDRIGRLTCRRRAATGSATTQLTPRCCRESPVIVPNSASSPSGT